MPAPPSSTSAAAAFGARQRPGHQAATEQGAERERRLRLGQAERRGGQRRQVLPGGELDRHTVDRGHADHRR